MSARERRRERRAVRRELREFARAAAGDWSASHPGSPLGPGMPTGSPLREDGESHREAWMRVLRADPCSYCGGPGGTVDHVDARSGPRPAWGLHSWTNYVGACGRCNGAKSDERLLLWLCRRPVLRDAPAGLREAA